MPNSANSHHMYVGFADSVLYSKRRRSLFECVIRGGENIIASLQDFTRGRIWKFNRSNTHLHAQNRSSGLCGPTTQNGDSLGIDTQSKDHNSDLLVLPKSRSGGTNSLGERWREGREGREGNGNAQTPAGPAASAQIGKALPAGFLAAPL